MGKIGVSGFNHTAFVVSDLDRAIGFFRDLLGFELTSRAPRNPKAIQDMTGLADVDIEVAYLRGLDHWIELIRYEAPADRGRPLPKIFQDGAGHIAFDVDDAAAAVREARAYGLLPIGEIVTIDQGPNQGRKVVYLQSSDGLSVEFIQAPH
ncbi:MAG: VOC family protein [Alphaproteobacteria bacterium]|nr:VOC family protein [Alphaproteobacteria bacterium]